MEWRVRDLKISLKPAHIVIITRHILQSYDTVVDNYKSLALHICDISYLNPKWTSALDLSGCDEAERPSFAG